MIYVLMIVLIILLFADIFIHWRPSLAGENRETARLTAAFNNLKDEVRRRMATQEERLQALIGKVANVQAGVDRIQSELEAFKAGNPQLEDELAGLEAAVGALATDVAAPTPETPPEG